MCTVSFVFSDKKAIITHNRDEKVLRPSAIKPKKYVLNNKEIYFPKDTKAGGTWFAVDQNGTVLVLLNGAQEKHQLKPLYKKSRGLIVLEIISSQSPINFWHEIDLENIEPFTLILFQNSKLYQLRWNEIQKSILNLDVNQKHIWSSATLYSKEIREHRSNLFHVFLDKKQIISDSEMLHFHRYTEPENQENGLIINRNNELKTLSTTQTVIQKNNATILHCDLIAKQNFEIKFIIN